MEETTKQEFRVRDLKTRSVTLFPQRAQVIRDIKDVVLHPGLNQVIIDGLSPTVDEHSIKVEGSGAAKVTEVKVECLPNREFYDEVYPEDTEVEEAETSESESDSESASMKALDEKIRVSSIALEEQNEKTNSAATRLQLCDTFGKNAVGFSTDGKHVQSKGHQTDELEKILKVYKDEREKMFQDHASSIEAAQKITVEIQKCNKEKYKLSKALAKSKAKARKEKSKQEQKETRRKAEALKEKMRIKAERELFWPKKVYRITISLEPQSVMTPLSSRRSSIATTDDKPSPDNLASTTFHQSTEIDDGKVQLSLSYVTDSASWSPRYDLSLDTLTCTGVLDYGAQLTNFTSETWRDAKIILSTSQTSFGGLNEEIPVLHPWRVGLHKKSDHRQEEASLFSDEELIAHRKQQQYNGTNTNNKRRDELFGVGYAQHQVGVAFGQLAQSQQEKSRIQTQGWRDLERPASGRLFGNQSTSQQPASGFGVTQAASASALHAFTPRSAVAAPMGAPSVASSFGATHRMAKSAAARVSAGTAKEKIEEEESEDESENSESEVGKSSSRPHRLQFEPAANSLVVSGGTWAESGLTTTYDLPSTKTISPSSNASSHKISKVVFKDIAFSHVVVGKLRPAAFLQAALKNSAKITLLKGPLGLTLDSAFLGQTKFPRCAPGESFVLPLGVDPGVTIEYVKPTMKKAVQSGLFSKEDRSAFVRNINVGNTKGAPVEVKVMDQVPVSEDQNLRIEILKPKGVVEGGESVKAGKVVDGKEERNARGVVKEKNWGKAEARREGSGGKIVWDLKLLPGCKVSLGLEYEMTFPGGEFVVNR